MIVNNKLIFIHVPKTGGSSVRTALKANHKMTMPCAFHCALRSANFPTSTRFAFGFIRNPYPRIVSHYRFMCQKPIGPNDHKVYKREEVIAMGFKKWVLEGKFGSFIREAVGPHANAESVHHIPQMWWLRGCDFIGRFERLQEDFDHAMRQVGYDPIPLPAEKIHKTRGRDWRLEYDNELYDFVTQQFAEDIAQGGYEFDRTGITSAVA